jgi:hypothetical protein
VGIAVLGLTVEEEVHGSVEQLDRFVEAPLRCAEWRLEIEKDGLVAQRVPGTQDPCLPPGVRHFKTSLGGGEIALHLACVAEPGPGEASELVDPLVLEGLTPCDHVCRVDRQVGKVGGLGRLYGRGLAAFAD